MNTVKPLLIHLKNHRYFVLKLPVCVINVHTQKKYKHTATSAVCSLQNNESATDSIFIATSTQDRLDLSVT